MVKNKFTFFSFFQYPVVSVISIKKQDAAG